MANTRQAKANNANRIAVGVLLIIVSLFCFLSVVGALGGVGKMVYSFLVGFFGLAAYAYSLMGLTLGIAVTFNVRIKMRPSKILIYFGLLMLGILALQIYTSSGHIINKNYGDYLLACYKNTNTAGGMLFGILAFPIMKAITPIGALIVVCATFFVLAFFAIIPSIKRNVTYTAATRKEREAKQSKSKVPLFEKPIFEKKDKSVMKGQKIDTQTVPVLTDFSQASNGGKLFVVDVDGDPLQKKTNKKLKGAEGYNPLYPNAMGAFEDEQKSEDAIFKDYKFSKRGIAKDILFGKGPNEDNLSKFNTINNPNEALTNVGAPYNAFKRNELRNKLGIDTTQSAIKEDFMARYRAENQSASDVSVQKDNYGQKTNTADINNIKASMHHNNVANQTQKDVDAQKFDFKKDFYALKQEQIQRFNDMYSNVKPEFEATAYDTPNCDGEVVQAENIKKEVVKPTRVMPHIVDDINLTAQKAESAIEKGAVMAGLQGAVNRAIAGEELPQRSHKFEIEADAYDVPNTVTSNSNSSVASGNTNAQNNNQNNALFKNTDIAHRSAINTVQPNIVNSEQIFASTINKEEIKNQPKIPRAFAATAITKEITDINSNQSVQNSVQQYASQQKAQHVQPPSMTNGNQQNVQSSFVKPYEMQKATLQPKREKYVDSDNIQGGEMPSAPAPKQQAVTGGEMSRVAIQTATAIAKQSPKNIENAEMKARIENIKQARKEAPPLSAFEQAEKLKEEKMRAAQSRGMQKADIKTKKSNNIDTTTERLTQVNMEQAIAQANPKRPYVAPPMSLLEAPTPEVSQDEDYEQKKEAIVNTLSFFGITAEVIDIMVGPTFSMYTLKVEMPRGRTISYISSLESDIAMKMEEESVRIIAPIPGRNAVGIEVPNKHRRMVRLSEIIGSPAFNQSKSPATFALGKNLYGSNYVVDVKNLPHALIAGATGAGKSCCINSIIISLLYKASPDDVRFIMVDPKRVELSIYAGIPHLLMDEIICDTDKAIRALNWAITEMNRRIQYLAEVKYRDIDEYNADCAKLGYEKMPRIIIIVDEFADLMSMGKKAVEDSINRIARLARAVGIHLLLATQRPSVDVVSGTIKNNLPSRVAFKVTSSFDSKTILDSVGADKLLGNGDLLYMTPKSATLERMQGAFISNEEVKRVVDFIKEHNDSYFDNNIKDAIFKDKEEEKSEGGKERKSTNGVPPELFDALRMGIELDGNPITISNMQRKLGLGWPKAAKIYDMMDDMGYLTVDERDPKKKHVNITADELDEIIREYEEDDKK